MSKHDWRRYYFIVWSHPYLLPTGFRDLDACREEFEYCRAHYEEAEDWRKEWRMVNKPLGIIHVKGKSAAVQQWLYNRVKRYEA